MSGPNTRSIYGTTYVYKENRLEKNSSLAKTAKLPFIKAQVVSTLLRDYPVVESVANKYKDKHLKPSNRGLTQQEKESHKDLLGMVSTYCREKTYQKFVSSVKDMSAETLMSFSQNWIELHHEFLEKAMGDWKTTAHKALKANRRKPQSEEAGREHTADEVSRVVEEMRSSFTHLSAELSNLSRTMASRNASRVSRRSSSEEISSPDPEPSVMQPIELARPQATLEVRTKRIPKTEVLTKMWQNSQTRQSAKFLSSFLFTAEKMPQVLLGISTDVSDETIMSLTEEQIIFALPRILAHSIQGILSALKNLTIEPVGRLFLERLDFSPVAHVKGFWGSGLYF